MSALEDDIIKAQTEQALHIAAVTGQDHLIEKAVSDIIEKGKKAEIGEIRTYSGVEWRKVSATGNPNKDWVRVRKTEAKPILEEKEKKPEKVDYSKFTPEQLEDLKKTFQKQAYEAASGSKVNEESLKYFSDQFVAVQKEIDSRSEKKVEAPKEKTFRDLEREYIDKHSKKSGTGWKFAFPGKEKAGFYYSMEGESKEDFVKRVHGKGLHFGSDFYKKPEEKKPEESKGEFFIGYNKGRGLGTGVLKDKSYATYAEAKKEAEKTEKMMSGSSSMVAYYVANKDGEFVEEPKSAESAKDRFERTQKEFDRKWEEMQKFGSGWKPGFSRNFNKEYGSEKAIKTMIISTEANLADGESWYQTRVGSSKSFTMGKEHDDYTADRKELESKKFNTVKEAASAADKFAAKYNSKEEKDKKAETIAASKRALKETEHSVKEIKSRLEDKGYGPKHRNFQILDETYKEFQAKANDLIKKVNGEVELNFKFFSSWYDSGHKASISGEVGVSSYEIGEKYAEEWAAERKEYPHSYNKQRFAAGKLKELTEKHKVKAYGGTSAYGTYGSGVYISLADGELK